MKKVASGKQIRSRFVHKLTFILALSAGYYVWTVHFDGLPLVQQWWVSAERFLAKYRIYPDQLVPPWEFVLLGSLILNLLFIDLWKTSSRRWKLHLRALDNNKRQDVNLEDELESLRISNQELQRRLDMGEKKTSLPDNDTSSPIQKEVDGRKMVELPNPLVALAEDIQLPGISAEQDGEAQAQPAVQPSAAEQVTPTAQSSVEQATEGAGKMVGVYMKFLLTQVQASFAEQAVEDLKELLEKVNTCLAEAEEDKLAGRVEKLQGQINKVKEGKLHTLQKDLDEIIESCQSLA
jgi:hypothetical protein